MLQNKCEFFLFGMGNRKKYYYKDGVLYSFPSNREAYRFDVARENIFPDRYRAEITEKSGEKTVIFENEQGLYLQNKYGTCALSESFVSLPDFEEYEDAALLRILHHEILFNITESGPLPNCFIYDTPWYRDGAMVTHVLEKTGNLALIRDWILGLRDPYDRNNKGCEEPDNLGQALYMISRVSDSSHPLVPIILSEVNKHFKNGVPDTTVDYSSHPVYAAKWLNYGLESLSMGNMKIPIPKTADDYSSLFWMDYQNEHVSIPHRDYDSYYPYLWWAEQHFYKNSVDLSLLNTSYPVTNETCASEADYEKIRPLSEKYADEHNASPHTWHAAEMFLYLTDLKLKRRKLN